MNNNNIFFILLFLISLSFSSCSVMNNPSKIKSYVLVSTTQGDFVIGLYEGTPQHKLNFLQNISDEVYDSCLVYSVIQNGIFKLGLPKEEENEEKYFKKNSTKSGIKKEINPKLLNKTGAVGMLCLPDENNLEKLSDTKLFYIVEGVKTDEKLLKTLVAKRNAPLIAEYMTPFLEEPANLIYKDSLDFYRAEKKSEDWNRLYAELTLKIIPRIENDGKKLFAMNKYQMETYSVNGGAPIYDGENTVFGEIVYGIEILSKLSKLKTNAKNKPKENIFILETKILTKKELKDLNK